MFFFEILQIIAHADIITPNFFEMEVLSGEKLQTKEDAIRACAILHEKGVKTVVMTGLMGGENIVLVGSTKGGEGEEGEKFWLEFPSIGQKFTGTGDMFASLLLSWISKGDKASVACEKAVGTMQAVLKRTVEMGGELKIVQSRGDIEEPKIIYQAQSF